MAPAGYVCEFRQFPAVKWGSSSDQTGKIPGLVCTKLEKPLPGSGPSAWAAWWKIARLIENFPF